MADMRIYESLYPPLSFKYMWEKLLEREINKTSYDAA